MSDAAAPFVGRPARFERIRCAIARNIYIHHRYLHRLALRIVPADHPWKLTIRSASEAMEEVTDATLYPRTHDGHPPVPHVPTRAPRFYRRVEFWTKAVILWLIADMATRAVPGPIGDATQVDDSIRLLARLGAAFNGFLAG